MSILNVSMGGGTDYSGIILRLGKKTKKTGIGMRKVEKSGQETGFKRKTGLTQRTRIKPISPKGRKRKKIKAKSGTRIQADAVYFRAKRVLAQVYAQVLGGSPEHWMGAYECDHIAGHNGNDYYGIPNHYSISNLQFLTHDQHALKTNAVEARDGITQRHDFRSLELRNAIGNEEAAVIEALDNPNVWTAQEFREAYESRIKK